MFTMSKLSVSKFLQRNGQSARDCSCLRHGSAASQWYASLVPAWVSLECSWRPYLTPKLTDFKNVCLVYRAEALVALHSSLERICGDALDLRLAVHHGIKCESLPSLIFVKSLQARWSVELHDHLHGRHKRLREQGLMVTRWQAKFLEGPVDSGIETSLRHKNRPAHWIKDTVTYTTINLKDRQDNIDL